VNEKILTTVDRLQMLRDEGTSSLIGRWIGYSQRLKNIGAQCCHTYRGEGRSAWLCLHTYYSATFITL